MIGVKIIITGLLGIVPQPDLGTVSLVAVDTFDADSCRIPPIHLPLLVSWRGRCASGCQFPQEGENFEPKTELGKLIDDLVNNGWINPGTEFFWLPVERQVRLGFSSHPVRPVLSGSSMPAMPLPSSDVDVGSWRWILPLEKLAAAPTIVNRRCIQGKEDCLVSAKLDVPFGTLGACHLIGRYYDRDTSYVDAYELERPGGGPSAIQAIADFSVLEFRFPGKSLTVEASCLDGHCGYRQAVLLPDDHDEITLLFANFVINPYSAEHIPHLEYIARIAKNPGAIGRPAETCRSVEAPLTAPSCKGLESFINELNERLLVPEARERRRASSSYRALGDELVLEVPLNKPECGPVVIRN